MNRSEMAFKLTPRESQIVDLLLDGAGNKEIADKLKIKPRTVKAYFHKMFIRAGITDGIKRVKLAVMIYRERNGLE